MGFPNNCRFFNGQITAGRVVGVHLDFDNGTLGFSVNGGFIGNAYTGISQRGGPELTLSVAIHTTGDSVQIVSGPNE